MEDEQHILLSLLESREELYQKGTAFIFEALKPVLDGIIQFLKISEDSIEWIGVDKVNDYVIIAGVVHINNLANGRPIRVGMPLHVAEQGNIEEVIGFLEKSSTSQKMKNVTKVAKETGNSDFDLQQLSKEQIEKINLTIPVLDKIISKYIH